MTNVNPEDFRAEMQAIYAENHVSKDFLGRTRSESIVFDELSYFKDGKKEFIIGTRKEREDVPTSDREDAHTKTRSTLFCMPLEKGKLFGEPLKISASSCGEYAYRGRDRDGPYEGTKEAQTSVEITIGNQGNPNFNYSKTCTGYHDVTDFAQVSDAVVLGKCDRYYTDVKGDRETAIKICDRFLEPRGEASRLVKAEQKRQKWIKRYRELRAMVEKKRAKLAEKQAKQKAKEEERKRVEEAKMKKAMRDNFLH